MIIYFRSSDRVEHLLNRSKLSPKIMVYKINYVGTKHAIIWYQCELYHQSEHIVIIAWPYISEF